LFSEKYQEIKIGKRVLSVFFLAVIGVLAVNGLQIDKLIKFALMGLLALITVGIAVFKFHQLKKLENPEELHLLL
jgi:uncharacterized membrane protein (Fun14 family)